MSLWGKFFKKGKGKNSKIKLMKDAYAGCLNGPNGGDAATSYVSEPLNGNS